LLSENEKIDRWSLVEEKLVLKGIISSVLKLLPSLGILFL
jgi:hypothetical protein